MRIRSITCFLPLQASVDDNALQNLGNFAIQARQTFESAGFSVQTVRLATTPFSSLALSEVDAMVDLACAMEGAARKAGFEYLSLGPAFPENLAPYAYIPEMLAATQSLFLGGVITTQEGCVSPRAVHRCAQIIHQVAALSADGFTNLRFAALANVPAGAPFFPAAYHRASTRGFALALEAADLAVQAFMEARDLASGRQRLVDAIEGNAHRLSDVARRLANTHHQTFMGLDFTLAPFPQTERSIGTALERMGVPAVGYHGSLAAAAILADTLDQARFPRAGFCGLMFPLLEDHTLAQRAAQGYLSIKDLLLFSTVCGTGLDTVPLSEDTSVEQIDALLFDLAALSLRLGKPLTARLMPVPGKRRGEFTSFDFPYFANSRVLGVEAEPLGELLSGEQDIPIRRGAHSAT